MKYQWHNEASKAFLERDYLLPGETVEQRVHDIARYAQQILQRSGSKEFDTFYEDFTNAIEKGWYSLSTPVWSNFGRTRGLPISCFGSSIEDTMSSILYTVSEVGMMSKLGGGTSAYFGKLRPRGAEIKDNGTSCGSVGFMKIFDTLTDVVSQGSLRRGRLAAYLDIEHPDIQEFLMIKTEGSPIQELSYGVCVGDAWLQAMKDGDEDKRKIWARVLQSRAETGYPYIMFTDNVNNNTVDVYKDKNLRITHSNLCSEILLPDNKDESFVCNLSSMNILHYDEWKNTKAVQTLTYFLDAVMTDFIEKAEQIPFMERAVEFAKNHRALGIGWLGWHSYLQSHRIPFEGLHAKQLTSQIGKFIYDQAYEASRTLAGIFGEPEVLKGYGRRNTTLIAIAPTVSSAFILGQVSQSIEPLHSNYFIKDTAKGKFTIKNPYLEQLLTEKGLNTAEIWSSILKKGGSVQHLEQLTQEEKDVFKTFQEMSQMEIIIQASIRQKWIDQGQSLNITVHPSIPTKDVNALILEAHKLGVKTLYYQFSVNAAQEFARDILTCVSCE